MIPRALLLRWFGPALLVLLGIGLYQWVLGPWVADAVFVRKARLQQEAAYQQAVQQFEQERQRQLQAQQQGQPQRPPQPTPTPSPESPR